MITYIQIFQKKITSLEKKNNKEISIWTLFPESWNNQTKQILTLKIIESTHNTFNVSIYRAFYKLKSFSL